MFTVEKVQEKLSKLTDKFEINQLTSEEVELLLEENKRRERICCCDIASSLLKQFKEGMIRLTANLALDTENHFLLYIIYYKEPLENLELDTDYFEIKLY